MKQRLQLLPLFKQLLLFWKVWFYAIAHVAMLSKKHKRSSTVHEEGLRTEGSDPLHKQAHDTRGIAEQTHAYIWRAR